MNSTATGTHRTTLAEKLAWGAGGMTESLVNSIYALAFPIFSIGMGMGAALLGIAQAVPRLIDAFTDPIMGNISDRARTRWGRRRPFIFCGAILSGLTLPLIFMPDRAWPEHGLFLWFTGLTVIFFLGFTIWSIPWSALGLELSDDYNDRTRLQIARLIFATAAGVAIAWAYKLAFLFDKDEVAGVRPVVWIIGGLMAASGILSALFIREWRYEAVSAKDSLRLLPALKLTLSNGQFLLLCLTVLTFAGGVIMVEPLAMYVNIFHVCGGDRDAAATIMGTVGTVAVVVTVLLLPLGGWVAGKLGKRRAAFLALGMIAAGEASQFWLVTPHAPYLQVVSRLLFQPGIMLMWALVPSMIADVCDLDELRCGQRREASFSSAYQWIWKLGATLAMTVGGGLITLAGADVQSATGSPPPESVMRLRVMLAVVPAALACLAMFFVSRYSISRARFDEMQVELVRRKEGGPSVET